MAPRGARVAAGAALSLAALLGVTLGLATLEANRLADASLGRGLADVRRGVQALLTARAANLAAMGHVSVEVPQFRERLLKTDERAAVLEQAAACRQLLRAAWVLVTNQRGILVARTDYPEEVDVDLSRGALVAGAMSGESSSGAWLDERLHELFMAVAVPIRASPSATPEGTLVAAYAIDDSLAFEIKRATASDVVLFARDTLGRPYVVGGTLPRDAVDAALAADTATLQRFAGDSAVEVAAVVGGERLIGLAGPIRSAGGDAFGGFIVFRSHERESAAFAGLRRTLAVALALGLALALFASVRSLQTRDTPGPPSIRPAADR
jgi:hypothetical protein